MSHPDISVDLLPDGALRLSFPYDQYLLSLVRQIPGRRWHAEKKFWSAPRPSFRALRELAAGAGVGVAPSERVRQALALGQARQTELATAKADETPMALPTQTTPRPYQYAGIRYAKHALHNFHGALIGDDPGLGKTFEALSLVAIHERLRDVLVLCPATLKYVWEGQIREHYPQLTYTLIEGSAEERAAQWAEPSRIKIANYELLVPKHERACAGGSEKKRKAGGRCNCGARTKDLELRLREWDLTIADEITFLKSFRAQRTKRAKKLRSRYRLALSGIPLENRLEELHTVMDWVIPGLLGPGWLFVEEHCIRDRWGTVKGYRGVEKVRERIAPYMIRRRKADVLRELPPKVYTDVALELSDDEWKLYAVIVQQIKEKIAENPKLNVANILVEILRLKQATGDGRLLGEDVESTKLAALRDIVQASGDHQIVAFSQFAQLARLWLGEFEGAAIIDGAVTGAERAQVIEAFQRGDTRLLLSTDAGAYGITLTAADIVVHVDQPWTPARMRQREDRLHRIGQKSSVQVVNLLARRTVDERVRAILHKKSELIKAILDEEAPDVDAVQISRGDVMNLLLGDE